MRQTDSPGKNIYAEKTYKVLPIGLINRRRSGCKEKKGLAGELRRLLR
jgi:hypothetical protein